MGIAAMLHTYELGGSRLPVVLEPRDEPIDLAELLKRERASLEGLLLERGALLFRGFDVSSDATFERCARAVCPELLDYVYGSTPRTSVGKGVYTATEYPPAATIPFHNELSYTLQWPLKLMFACLVPATKGGETPLADSVRVSERIDPAIRAAFKRRKIAYVRNYREGVDIPWQKAFMTDDRSAVEAFCRAHSIEFEWGRGDELRTRQVCQAVASHPRTGQEIWFNQVHLFHITSLDPASREALLSTFGERDLPRNTYYGDGGRIEDEVLEQIRGAYAAERVSFPWETGDFLVLDNMLVAHSRNPFVGLRKIRVAMGEPSSTSP